MSTTAQRKDISIDHNGKTYTLELGVNSMVLLEDLFSTADNYVSVAKVMAQAEAGSFRHIRGFFWSTLQKHHSDMNIEQVGTWISEIGLDTLNEKIAVLNKANMPPKAKARATKPPVPAKAAGNAGKRSKARKAA